MSNTAAPLRLGLLGDSFVYACPALRSTACRHAVTLACALTPNALSVTAGGKQLEGRIVVTRPFTPRRLDTRGHPVVLIDLEPTHLRYNTFSRLPTSQPVRVLDAERFSGLLRCAQAFADGELQGRRLQAAVQLQVADVADSFGPPDPLDRRVLQMMAALRLDPGTCLGELSAQVGLSSTQASRTFVEALGLTVRQYALAVKIQRAAMYFGSNRPLTDIALASGFTDSAHLAKVWVRCYGAPPSHYFAEHCSTDDGRVEHAWRQRVSLERHAAPSQQLAEDRRTRQRA